MNLRKILLAAAGLGMMILNTSAQTSKRYTVAKPGTLVMRRMRLRTLSCKAN